MAKGEAGLTRVERADLRTPALWTDWHSVSPVVFPGRRLAALERRGLVETRLTGGPVWPKREARLTEAGRAEAAGLPEED